MAINEMTDSRYYGKICNKHPEFKGLRRKKSYKCVQCTSESGKKNTSREALSAEQVTTLKIEKMKYKIDDFDRERVRAIEEFENARGRMLGELKELCEELERAREG